MSSNNDTTFPGYLLCENFNYTGKRGGHCFFITKNFVNLDKWHIQNKTSVNKFTLTCKKRGKEYEYYLNPFISNKDGFTLMEKATAKLILMELSNAEMKLYSYLCSLFNSHNRINIGQEHLAEVIGKSRNRVCELTNDLNNKGFLSKTTNKIQNVLYCTYNLNY